MTRLDGYWSVSNAKCCGTFWAAWLAPTPRPGPSWHSPTLTGSAANVVKAGREADCAIRGAKGFNALTLELHTVYANAAHRESHGRPAHLILPKHELSERPKDGPDLHSLLPDFDARDPSHRVRGIRYWMLRTVAVVERRREITPTIEEYGLDVEPSFPEELRVWADEYKRTAARRPLFGWRVRVDGYAGAGPSPEDLRVLGVRRGASRADVKAAFRAHAKIVHPDVGGDAAAFRALTDAYRRALAGCP